MNQFRLTPIVKNLLILNIVIFIILQLPGIGEYLFPYFLLFKSELILEHPEYHGYATPFHPIQLVTYFFNHNPRSLFHILFNMLMLVSLGPVLEMVMGAKRFLKFYLFCGVVGGMIIAFLDPSFNPVLGASVAMSGVLLAFAFYFPTQKLGFFLIPIQFEARQLAMGFAAISAILTVLSWQGFGVGGISHFGHLAGMVAGWLFFSLSKWIPVLGE